MFSSAFSPVAVRTVTTVGLGLATGILGAVPILFIPVLFKVDVSPQARLRVWSSLADRLNLFMRPLFGTVAALLVFTLYTLPTGTGAVPSGNWWIDNRETILTACTILHVSIGFITALLIEPISERLKQVEASFSKGETVPLLSSPSTLQDAETLLRTRWSSLYLFKFFLGLTALSLSAGDLAYAV